MATGEIVIAEFPHCFSPVSEVAQAMAHCSCVTNDCAAFGVISSNPPPTPTSTVPRCMFGDAPYPWLRCAITPVALSFGWKCSGNGFPGIDAGFVFFTSVLLMCRLERVRSRIQTNAELVPHGWFVVPVQAPHKLARGFERHWPNLHASHRVWRLIDAHATWCNCTTIAISRNCKPSYRVSTRRRESRR